MATSSKLTDQNAHQILDLSEDATEEEIERQFQRLSRLYEPDKLENPEDRAYAREKLEQIEDAYRTLSSSQQLPRPSREPAPEQRGQPPEEEVDLYCANHPGRETLLRCNKCGKPICMDCAVQTPVGYRCKECVFEQQNVYFNAAGGDNLIAFAVGFAVSAVAAPIVGLLIGSFGFFFGFLIAFIAGGGAGSGLAQLIRYAVGRRRGRRLPVFALAGIILGVMVGNLGFWLFTGVLPLFSLPMLLFTVLAISSAYPQLR